MLSLTAPFAIFGQDSALETRKIALQRAAPLMQLAPLLAAAGVSLEDALDGTGLSVDDIGPDRFIPFAAFLEILERSATLSGNADIGLQLGRRLGLGVLGPVGDVMRHAATLGEALADFAAFQILNCTGAAVYLHRVGDEVMWGYGIYDSAHAASPVIHDAVIAVGSALIAELARGRVRPNEITLMRPAPADPAPWRSLGAPVRFGQARTCMFLSRSAMARPLTTADAGARDAALAKVASYLARAPWGWAGRTRHVLRTRLQDGPPTMPEVARHLDIDVRTLRRALAREGTGFAEIRDQVRSAVACELLSLTRLPVGDVAEIVDFATPSSFVHAFRRWTGTTPSAWRARRDGEAG